MSAHRQHAHLAEWWPRVLEVRGERFEEGDEYAQSLEGLREAALRGP